jgi:C4-dicarboxylate-specific signal transduction histidine kinase
VILDLLRLIAALANIALVVWVIHQMRRDTRQIRAEVDRLREQIDERTTPR